MRTERPLEALETLLRTRVVAEYLDALVQEALGPRLERLTPAQGKALRAYLYDQLTSDPLLRGLVSRIGRALTARALPRSRGAR
jgi:hypothetical protein